MDLLHLLRPDGTECVTDELFFQCIDTICLDIAGMVQRSGKKVIICQADRHYLWFPSRDLHDDNVAGYRVIPGIAHDKRRSYLGLRLVGIGKIHKND